MNFARNGLRLGSRHVKEFGYSFYSYSVIPGLRRRARLLPSGPKSSFQMRASFVFHLETKDLESGGRVEKLIAQVGPLCFLKTNVTAPVYQEILEHFMLPSAEFSSRIWFLPTLPKAPKIG